MSAEDHGPDLSTQALQVLRELQQVSTRLGHTSTKAQHNALEDDLEKYKLWAGNLGAFYPASDRRSLEYRLRNAPLVGRRIGELLEELGGLLGEPIGNDGESSKLSSGDGDEAVLDVDQSLVREILDMKTSTECQETWWYASISDVIGRLFKVSKIIAKSTVRDRHARAEAATGSPFDASYDIAHVEHKYEKLKSKPWLLRRLGEAITKRRNYFRYCRNHREKLEGRTLRRLRDGETMGGTFAVPKSKHMSIPKTSAESRLSGEQTTASTLGPVNLDAVDDGFDDTQSFSTVANSLYEDKSSHTLSVPRLTEITQLGVEFECPYCFTVQRFNGQRGWRNHVLTDLQPYVCTFQECNLIMFPDRRSWEDHEMQVHRRYLQCQICRGQRFENHGLLRKHMSLKHKNIAESQQLELFLETCSQPMEVIPASACDFCDWSSRLAGLKENADIKEAEISVLAHHFSRHLARHLEQLALFALPRNNFLDEDSAMAGIGTKGSQNSSRVLSHSSNSAKSDLSDVEDVANPSSFVKLNKDELKKADEQLRSEPNDNTARTADWIDNAEKAAGVITQHPEGWLTEQQAADLLVSMPPLTGCPRVKVYEHKNGDWFDLGTGFCATLKDPATSHTWIVVGSEEDTSTFLLITGIQPDYGYQKQPDTVIVWTESNGRDMALSFQEAKDCAELWELILSKTQQAEAKSAEDQKLEPFGLDTEFEADTVATFEKDRGQTTPSRRASMQSDPEPFDENAATPPHLQSHPPAPAPSDFDFESDRSPIEQPEVLGDQSDANNNNWFSLFPDDDPPVQVVEQTTSAPSVSQTAAYSSAFHHHEQIKIPPPSVILSPPTEPLKEDDVNVRKRDKPLPPIAVDETDAVAIMRARNTAAARKARAKKAAERDELEEKIQSLQADVEHWKSLAMLHSSEINTEEDKLTDHDEHFLGPNPINPEKVFPEISETHRPEHSFDWENDSSPVEYAATQTPPDSPRPSKSEAWLNSVEKFSMKHADGEIYAEIMTTIRSREHTLPAIWRQIFGLDQRANHIMQIFSSLRLLEQDTAKSIQTAIAFEERCLLESGSRDEYSERLQSKLKDIQERATIIPANEKAGNNPPPTQTGVVKSSMSSNPAFHHNLELYDPLSGHQSSPLNTHINSRSGSGVQRVDLDDEPSDSSSASGSAKHDPASRDVTPDTHYFHNGSLLAIPELSERERKKIAKEEEMFRKQEEGRMGKQGKKKRNSSGSN